MPSASARVGRASPSAKRASAGRRRSMSIKSTRASSDCARAPPRLMAVMLLPSPTPGLVTPRICRFARRRKVSTRWRSTRYCSAAAVDGAWRLIRCSSTKAVATLGDETAGRTGPTAGRGGSGTAVREGAGGVKTDGRSLSGSGQRGTTGACSPASTGACRVSSVLSRSACSSALKNLLTASPPGGPIGRNARRWRRDSARGPPPRRRGPAWTSWRTTATDAAGSGRPSTGSCAAWACPAPCT